MDIIAPILDVIVIAIDLFSVAVLLYGTILCLKDFILTRIRLKEKQEEITRIAMIKNQLGFYILLGLEILIVGDIIETIVSPTFRDIALLAATVVIRTVISYFLNKEIQDASWKK